MLTKKKITSSYNETVKGKSYKEEKMKVTAHRKEKAIFTHQQKCNIANFFIIKHYHILIIHSNQMLHFNNF